MSDSAFSFLNTYISEAEAAAGSAALAAARADAEEYGLVSPSPALGGLISTLAARGTSGTGAVVMSPGAGVVGLKVLEGLPDKATLTCIDPEAEHQSRAKAIFRDAGYSPSRVRFLPSRPLDVLGRLANGAYHLVYADVEPVDLPGVINTAWPLLSQGGTLVLAGALLDGTLADESRKDRDTLAAREADDLVDTLEGAVVSRLPLDSGVTLVTRV